MTWRLKDEEMQEHNFLLCTRIFKKKNALGPSNTISEGRFPFLSFFPPPFRWPGGPGAFQPFRQHISKSRFSTGSSFVCHIVIIIVTT
jgi:hypothetical protein